MKPNQLELSCVKDMEGTVDSRWLRGMRVITRLKTAGGGSEMSVVDGPSHGAGWQAAAHGARVVLRDPWNGGA